MHKKSQNGPCMTWQFEPKPSPTKRHQGLHSTWHTSYRLSSFIDCSPSAIKLFLLLRNLNHVPITSRCRAIKIAGRPSTFIFLNYSPNGQRLEILFKPLHSTTNSTGIKGVRNIHTSPGYRTLTSCPCFGAPAISPAVPICDYRAPHPFFPTGKRE
jgi:hypothetical protein